MEQGRCAGEVTASALSELSCQEGTSGKHGSALVLPGVTGSLGAHGACCRRLRWTLIHFLS